MNWTTSCPVPDCDWQVEYPPEAVPGADLALAEHLRDEHTSTTTQED